MQKKYQLAGIVIAGALIAAIPAFAQTTANTTSTQGSKLSARYTRAETHANQEITRRIKALNALLTRVNAMQKLSSDEKSALATSIQSQIAAMNDLQTKIAADVAANSTSSLKADVQSITKSYRIFALILPQAAIEAAADRAETIMGTMNDLATKLQTRISSATSTANVSGAQTALTDFKAKVADANTQAQAAVTEVATLTPDNGDQTKMTANKAALQDARKKIQAAQQDFVAAKKDAQTIIQDLKVHTDVNATSSATTTAGGSL